MRSRLITHWTGKDIQTAPGSLSSAERERYVERLAGTLACGLWMTVPPEELHGWHPDGKAAQIGLQAPMTCFTELRLSGSALHAQRYGLLGFVFDRSFVLERAGGPVQYVRSHASDAVIGNMVQVLNWVNDQRQRGTDFAKEVLDCLFFNIGYIKAMSNPHTDDFAYLDELEWRIIHNDRQQSAGKLLPSGQQLPRYRIPFRRDDLKMLVLPDDETRRQALANVAIRERLTENLPPLLTVEELREF